MKRPLVGLTLGDADQKGFHRMREDYVRSVKEAGAVPVILPPVDPSDVGALLDRLDGVLLSGGADVDPALYGHAPHPRLGRVERRRDDFEIALVREALRRDVPVLGICRGQQVLNVATGGTLVQDIPSTLERAAEHDATGRRWRRSHDVAITPGTRLREILGQDLASVNSFHHQSVDAVGEGLVVSARCPEDGVVEGLEMPSRAFVIAVQWHPESFWDRDPAQLALFRAVVQAATR